MPREIRNVGASVRARLQNLSRETGQSFELILTRYALERLLYRLSTSAFSDRFVLKGAMLLTSWFTDPHRATRDLDLLGFGDPSPEAMVAAFREILATDVEDGVDFDSDAVRVDQIREELEYGGLRLRTTASINGARIAVTVDVARCRIRRHVGAGCRGHRLSVHAGPSRTSPARVRPRNGETVIAEKFQAIVALGRANSRMKDFYDSWLLSQSFPFDDDQLARAIAATFERRGTEIPVDLPDAHTPGFAEDEQKQRQWNAFLENVALRPGSLPEVIEGVAGFIMPHAIAAAKLGRSD